MNLNEFSRKFSLFMIHEWIKIFLQFNIQSFSLWSMSRLKLCMNLDDESGAAGCRLSFTFIFSSPLTHSRLHDLIHLNRMNRSTDEYKFPPAENYFNMFWYSAPHSMCIQLLFKKHFHLKHTSTKGENMISQWKDRIASYVLFKRAL